MKYSILYWKCFQIHLYPKPKGSNLTYLKEKYYIMWCCSVIIPMPILKCCLGSSLRSKLFVIQITEHIITWVSLCWSVLQAHANLCCSPGTKDATICHHFPLSSCSCCATPDLLVCLMDVLAGCTAAARCACSKAFAWHTVQLVQGRGGCSPLGNELCCQQQANKSSPKWGKCFLLKATLHFYPK